MDKKGSIISAVLAVGLGCIAMESIVRNIKVIADKAIAEEDITANKEAVTAVKEEKTVTKVGAQRGDLRNSQKDTTGDYKGINGDDQLVVIFNIGYFGGRRVK